MNPIPVSILLLFSRKDLPTVGKDLADKVFQCPTIHGPLILVGIFFSFATIASCSWLALLVFPPSLRGAWA